MFEMRKSFVVICEGRTDKEYLEGLNKFLEKEKININFVLKPVGSGHFCEVQRKYKKEYKKDKKARFVIWVDKDIYKRNDNNNNDKYLKKGKIPDFWFSYMNLEDFLIQHLNDEVYEKWKQICADNKHYEKPMTACVYLNLINKNKIFREEYKKSSMPEEIIIDRNSLNLLYKRNKKAERDNFVRFLEQNIKIS